MLSLLETIQKTVSLPSSFWKTALIFLLPLNLLWLCGLTFWIFKTNRWLKNLFGKTKKEKLREILQEHIERVGVVQIKLNDLENQLRQLENDSLSHIQKVSTVRFNPFKDTGGDQSFVLALLDQNDDGLVISSLHSREKTRIYAKPVHEGDPDQYPFSEEEKEAIKKAREA